MKFYLVAEGSTDQPIFERAIKTWCGEQAELILLEPQMDATTGRHDSFGYEGVLNWCNKMAGEKGKSIRGFFYFNQAKAVIVHLDADIAEELSLNSIMFQPSQNRVEWVEDILKSILSDLMSAPEIKIILAVPKMMTETWLLSTYDREELKKRSIIVSDYEEYPDVEQALVELGYEEKRDKPGRLKKFQNLYSTDPRYGARIETYAAVIEKECTQFEKFKESILSVNTA